MSSTKDNSFLGIGWAFPPSFDFYTRAPKMVSDEQDVKESLIILLSTVKKERVMLPDYGCNLIKLVFEQLDNSLYHYIVDLIKNAIILYEPRVEVEEITLKSASEKIFIYIDYTIRNTNSRHNLVYPFYVDQGTNIASHDKIY